MHSIFLVLIFQCLDAMEMTPGPNQDWKKGSVLDANGNFCMPWTDLPFPPKFADSWTWFWTAKNPEIPDQEQLEEMFPIHEISWKGLLKDDFTDISLTWIGHSTCYVVMAGGVRILTDPVFSDRASPIQLTGPKRFTPPACKVHELPVPDLVLISHDHYDHLDSNSIEGLEKLGRPIYCVGLGLKEWFMKIVPDEERIIELDWWQSQTLSIPCKERYSDVTVEFVPAQHWGSRSHFDRMQRLWGGWVVTDEAAQKFYFAGDTGFNEELFTEIGTRHGPIDLSAIPIGAYEPRWFMHPQHVAPEQAFRIHELVGSKYSVGIHWGTFPLTEEPVDEPKRLLEEAMVNAEDQLRPFITLEHGQTCILKYK